ncbi:MAG: hypothetical protein HUU37_04825 [Bdellovibrionales bacterium]|nr:hypothetical protein [Bdellovibrionales bacterium]
MALVFAISASADPGRRANFAFTSVNDFSSGAAAIFSSECILLLQNPSSSAQEISFRWRNPGSTVSGLNAGDGFSSISLSGASTDVHVFTLSAGAKETLTIKFPPINAGEAGKQAVTCAGEIIVKSTGAAPGFINVAGTLSSSKETPFSNVIAGKPFTGVRYNISRDEVLINGGRPL